MYNRSSSETDVLIVGAGPVGLLLACELQRCGVAYRIIDKIRDFPKTSRAMGVQPRTMEVLDSLGVAEQVLAQGHPLRGIFVMRGRRVVAPIEAHSAPRPDQPYRSVMTINQAAVEKHPSREARRA